MWLRHWSLRFDPFDGHAAHFVPLPTHVELLLRLERVMRGGSRLIELRGASGAGKSIVLKEILRRERLKGELVVVRIVEPVDEVSMTEAFSESLGRPVREAIRLSRLESRRLVMVVDGDQWLDGAARERARRLAGLDPHPASRGAVLLVGRPRDGEESAAEGLHLAPLGHSESAVYLQRRLAAACGPSNTFTPEAFAAIHLAAGGLPGLADGLARRAMMLAATRLLRSIDGALIHQVVEETDDPAALGKMIA